MRLFVKIMGSIVIAVLAAASSVNAEWYDDVVIAVEDLGHGIYMLSGGGGNIGVSIGDDGVFLIDDQYAPVSDKVLAALATVTDQPVDYIINTHWHGDHTGGNEEIGASGALIIAHDNVRTRMIAGTQSNVFGDVVDPSVEGALPVVTFSQDTTFHLNGLILHVFHVEPSHTDGDSVVEIQGANVIHMGDTFFHNWFPLIDYKSGGDLNGMINVQTQVLELVKDDTKIIPGHGLMATVPDLRQSRDDLTAVRDILVPLAASQMSVEEITAAKPLEPLGLNWGGFMSDDDFVSVAIAGLRAE